MSAPRLSGFEQSSFEALVRQQIAEPDPFGAMPKDLVTGSDAADVSAYVASVAGVELAKEQQKENGTSAPELSKRGLAPFYSPTKPDDPLGGPSEEAGSCEVWARSVAASEDESCPGSGKKPWVKC